MVGSRHILVVDDEVNICELLKIYLEKEGYKVDIAYDGIEALNKVSRGSPDLVILDILLPELDGWEVCRRIRAESNVPIIMLTAKGEEVDRVLGLELGADDYVPKPFSPREVVSRVKAVLRRATIKPEAPAIIEYPGLYINHTRREVRVADKPVNLTAKEFDILWLLASRPGKVFSRPDLLQTVWGYDKPYCDPRTVDQHIKRLRKKLGGQKIVKIDTVWGIGYKFEVYENAKK